MKIDADRLVDAGCEYRKLGIEIDDRCKLSSPIGVNVVTGRMHRLVSLSEGRMHTVCTDRGNRKQDGYASVGIPNYSVMTRKSELPFVACMNCAKLIKAITETGVEQ